MSDVTYLPGSYKLLGVGRDAKTRKGEDQGYLTGILYMSPAGKVGRLCREWADGTKPAPRWWDEYVLSVDGGLSKLLIADMCPKASEGCKAACLDTAGHGGFSPSVPIGRARKTVLWVLHRQLFWKLLRRDVEKLAKAAAKRGLLAQVRGNGTSDIRWEKYAEFRAICADFPQVRFYDYTKYPIRARLRGMPDNYRLTYSLSEKASSWAEALEYLSAGYPVSAVFATKSDVETVLQRGTWRGFPVVDGDEHDARFYDGAVITALKPKGKARNGTGGAFLQRACPLLQH